jgi:hypothetical protein
VVRVTNSRGKGYQKPDTNHPPCEAHDGEVPDAREPADSTRHQLRRERQSKYGETTPETSKTRDFPSQK